MAFCSDGIEVEVAMALCSILDEVADDETAESVDVFSTAAHHDCTTDVSMGCG